MVEVVCKPDCGNAPKKLLLRDFNIAFANNDTDFILEQLSDHIVWHMVGDRTIQGKANVEAALRKMTNSKATKLVLDHIITHGNTASANGVLSFDNGQRFAFCDVYEFSSFGKNAKIKAMTSYVFDVTADPSQE